MAVTSHATALLLLLLVLTCTPLALLQAADTHLHFFLHDVLGGSNPTAVQVIKGPAASGGAIPGLSFGDTTVVDDALTETSSTTSASVGRAQGFYMMSSQSGAVLMMCVNLLLTTGDYNGSTIAVIGRDDTAATVRELSVVGGTGKFRMATGYVLWKTASMNGADATVELDVYATTPNGAIDGSSSSGAAQAVYGRWVKASVVGVFVALVGGVW